MSVQARIESLDQYRGFTVLSMFVVNFLGNFDASPQILVHSHDYCSLADLVMPQFVFAAGFALRLSFVRQVEKFGRAAARQRMARRILGLIGVAVFWYSYTNASNISSNIENQGYLHTLGWLLKRGWFQTLTHIAVTTAWILPVLEARLSVRILYATASMLLHVILSAWFNFHWVFAGPLAIDGGPLGFLTWTAPMIAGTWACDLLNTPSRRSVIRPLIAYGTALAFGGWLLSSLTTLYAVGPETPPAAEGSKLAANAVIPSARQFEAGNLALAEPPFIPPPTVESRLYNYWMMSQRAGTASYLLFTAGTSCMIYGLFVLLCDRLNFHVSIFRTFGTNALAGYLVHDITGTLTNAFFSETSSLGPMLAALLIFLVITWWVLKWLENSGIYIRM